MNQESLLDTIRRLLALSRSDNEHEAQLAAAKAAELMQRYNIDMASVADRGTWVDETVGTFARLPRITRLVAGLVEDHFFVDAYTNRRPGIDVSVRFFGRKENVAVAVYVYHVLCRTFTELFKRYVDAHGRHGTAAYLIGVRDGYARAMKKMQANATTSAQAGLIVQEAKDREDALMRHVGGKLRTPKPAAYDLDPRAYFRGVRDGQEINVNTALPDDHPDAWRLLA